MVLMYFSINHLRQFYVYISELLKAGRGKNDLFEGLVIWCLPSVELYYGEAYEIGSSIPWW